MRVRRTVRPGTAWAAAAALIAAPLVAAPIVSAAEPGTDEAPAAVAAAAPATQASEAAVSASADAAPASSAPAAPASSSVDAQAPAAAEASAAESAPASQAAEEAVPNTTAAAPTTSAPKAESVTPAPVSQSLESSSSDAGTSSLAPTAPGILQATVVANRTASGSSRPTTGQAAGVAGATLTLQAKTRTRAKTSASWGNESDWTTLSTCVSVSDGTCSLAVPDIGDGTLKQYSSARIEFTSGGPAGSALIVVGTGNNGVSTTNINYLTLTASKLPKSDVTMQVTSSMASGLATGQQVAFTVVRDNPALIGKCGLKVGLLIDQSKSISDATNGVTNLKAAANAFVDALTGTPSQILIRNFADSSPNHATSEVGLTSTATATDAQPLKDAIAAMKMGAYTNWDAGLWRMEGLGLDAVVVVTDGVPTANMNGTSNPTTGGYSSTVGTVQHAVWSANVIKSQNTTVIAVGAGGSFNNTGAKLNLQAIASDDQHYVTADLSTLKTTLKDLAEKNCKGTVSVVKRVVNEGATGTTETTSTPGAGFNFKMGTGSYQATNVTGATSFEITSNAEQTFTEEQRSDYDIVAQNGMPAVCKTTSGSTVTVTKMSEYSWRIPASTTDTMTCTVYNKKKPKVATVKINHVWVDESGTDTLTDAQVGEVLNAPLIGAPKLTIGSASAWTAAPAYGDTVATTTSSGTTKLVEGDTATVAVRTDPGLAKSGYDCEWALLSVTHGSATGATSLTSTLVGGENVFTVTHKLTCTTDLTLIKVLDTADGDTVTKQAWDLSMTGLFPKPNTAPTTVTDKTGVKSSVRPGAAYTIGESSGPSNLPADTTYEQTSVMCTNGTYSTSTQSVTVDRGKSAVCTFTNTLLRIDVKKSAFQGTPNPLSDGIELPSGSSLTGGAITWLFTISNTGKAPFTVTGVNDPALGNAAVTCSATLTARNADWGPFNGAYVLSPGNKYYCKATGSVSR